MLNRININIILSLQISNEFGPEPINGLSLNIFHAAVKCPCEFLKKYKFFHFHYQFNFLNCSIYILSRTSNCKNY